MAPTAILSSSTSAIDSYFDLDAALERCCDDADFLTEMIDLLGSSVATQREAIALAIRCEDPKALSESSHALKGAIASMTTSVPFQLARELEILGKDGGCTGADALFAALQISLDRLLHETHDWVAQRKRTPSS